MLKLLFILIGLSTTLLSMRNEDEYLLEKLEQLSIEESSDDDKQEKIYDDFSSHYLGFFKELETTKVDEDHEMIILKTEADLFKFIVRNIKTNLEFECGELKVPEIKKSIYTLFVDDKKDLFLFYGNKKSKFKCLKIHLTDYIDFSQEINPEYMILFPVKMVSFELDDRRTFRAIMTSYGSGFFGIYNDRFSEESHILDEDSGKICVTDIDAMKVDNESFIIAFVSHHKRIYLFYWKVGDDAHHVKNFSMDDGIQKIILNKEIKKIEIKFKNHELFYIDFPKNIKKLLI